MQNSRTQVFRATALLMTLATGGLPASVSAHETTLTGFTSAAPIPSLRPDSVTGKVRIRDWPSIPSEQALLLSTTAPASLRTFSPPRAQLHRPTGKYGAAERFLVAVGMGAAGFYVGGLVGYGIGS